jgi:hypothetical protein
MGSSVLPFKGAGSDMMRSLFRRKGIWLFALAIVWYLAGCFINQYLNKKAESSTKNSQGIEEKFEITNVSELAISAAPNCANVCNNIYVIFDPSISFIKVSSEGLGVSAKGEVKEGKFTILLDKVATRNNQWGKKLFVYLPSAIHQIGFMKLSSVDISGSFPEPDTHIDLVLLDSKSSVNVGDIKVGSLNLKTTGTTSSDDCGCTSGFDVEKKAKVNNLEATMSYGHLKYASSQLPQHTVLNLSDAVEITAHKEFIKSAQINNIP